MGSDGDAADEGPTDFDHGSQRMARLTVVHRLMDAEVAQAGAPSWMIGQLQCLCQAVTRAVPAAGAGVSMVSPSDGGASHTGGGIAASSSPQSWAWEELQFTFGEGPCLEAVASHRAVSEPDMAGRGVQRWPGYGPAAQAGGVAAVFAFPLRVGRAGLGALDIYRAHPGSLPPAAWQLAHSFAEVALDLILVGQDQAEEGAAAAGLDQALSYRWEVYQAQGMVMVDLGVDPGTALVRLRAHAFSSGRPLAEVAADVVAGRLRLHRDTLEGR